MCSLLLRFEISVVFLVNLSNVYNISEEFFDLISTDTESSNNALELQSNIFLTRIVNAFR